MWNYCASCGSRTGRHIPVGSGSKLSVLVITLVAVFMIIPVTGILAAIAIPNLLTAMQRSKQKRTMADMRSLATAIEAYATDHNTFPASVTGVDGLQPMLVPTYMRTVPALDAWARPLRYECLKPQGDTCLEYAIQSSAKDGVFDELPAQSEIPLMTTDFDCDIVYSGGSFVVYPEGVQRGQ